MRVVNKRRSFGQEMNKEKFHVWWKPQVPTESFLVEVDSVEEGYKLLRVLEEYDFFQYYTNIKPDYANAGGLIEWDNDLDPDEYGEKWADWCCPVCGEYVDRHELGENGELACIN